MSWTLENLWEVMFLALFIRSIVHLDNNFLDTLFIATLLTKKMLKATLTTTPSVLK